MLAPGAGVLEFARVEPRTVLQRAFAKSPLRIIHPKNHGSAAWVYLSSFGGGLVGGDHVDLRVKVGARAKAVLLTQASTKVFNSSRQAAQTVDADVEKGGMLIVAPDPTVCFAGPAFFASADVPLGGGCEFGAYRLPARGA